MGIIVVFILELILLSFISRKNTQLFFTFFHRISRSHTISYILLTLLYLPGTIVHEISHMICAFALLLHVRSISFLPTIEGSMLKLGEVTFEQKGNIRSMLVGIAPLFGGLIFLYLIFYFSLFSLSLSSLTIGIGYLIFSVTSNMFPSQQDLKEIVFIIPLLIILAIVLALGQLVIPYAQYTSVLLHFLKNGTIYLGISLVINSFILLLLMLVKKI